MAKDPQLESYLKNYLLRQSTMLNLLYWNELNTATHPGADQLGRLAVRWNDVLGSGRVLLAQCPCMRAWHPSACKCHRCDYLGLPLTTHF